MNIKRFSYNTIAVLIALVLVFGSFSQAFAEITSGIGSPLAPAPIDGITTSPNAPLGPSVGPFLQTSNTQIDPGQVNFNNSSPDGSSAGSSSGGSGAGSPARSNDPQANNALNPQGPGSSATNTPTASTNNYGTITSNALGCSVGQLLASVITSGITSALNGISSLLGVWTGLPTHDAQLNATQAFQTATSHGFQIFGVYVGVSLNSIAYCIVNSILEYIANSTIQWANTGFNGNPAFVQNPERFFQGLADQQASSFIRALAYNSSAGGAAMNVCQPFRTNVALQLANSYGTYGNTLAGNSGFAAYGSCGLTSTQQSNFINGKSLSGFWSTVNDINTNDRNSYIGTVLNGQNYLAQMNAQRIASAQRDLSYGQGYQSYWTCTNPNDRNTCNITTPGTTINKSLQNTLNSGQNRLVAANQFDQVVTTVVNNLVRLALNKLLAPTGVRVPGGTNFVGPARVQTSNGTGVNTGSGGNTGIYNAQGVLYTSQPPSGAQTYDAGGVAIPIAQPANAAIQYTPPTQ